MEDKTVHVLLASGVTILFIFLAITAAKVGA